jgi:hypothetical protein
MAKKMFTLSKSGSYVYIQTPKSTNADIHEEEKTFHYAMNGIPTVVFFLYST